MKKILKILLITTLFLAMAISAGPLYLHASRWTEASFCDRPVTFMVNNVDPRFKISKEQVIEDSKAAAEIWNNLAEKEIFVYNPNSTLDINLVFDERQSSVNEISQKIEEVDQEKDLLTSDIEELERRKKAIAQDLGDLNDEIEYWNKRGGAPKEKYDELVNKQRELQQEVAIINQTAKKLNATTGEVNEKIETLNQNVKKFNELLSIKPEEGMYYAGPHKIDVFIYENQTSFRHTVAHELGHALGLDHVDQADSLMYPVSSPDSHASEADKELLETFCQDKNRLDLIESDLKNLLYIVYSKVTLFLDQ